VFYHIPKYHIKTLLGDISAKLREDIFKLTAGNESFHEVSNDNGVRVVNFATKKNLVVKSMMLLHQTIINTP
jgi:hypothetical protein